MLIKVKSKPKDCIEGPPHKGITRRDLLKGGLATGALSVVLPEIFSAELAKAQAQGSPLQCPVATMNPGAIAQIYSSGGCAMSARFFSEAQAESMNATMASHYGISGTNLKKLASGIVVDSTSSFGATLIQGPPGFPGGPAAWQAKVLNNTCGGGHLGPFTVDDAVGSSAGLMGSVSLDKSSQLGKDIYFNPTIPRATWTNGTPAAYVGAFGVPSTATLLKPFSLSPAATSNTSPNELNIAATGAINLAQALAPSFGTATRKGASALLQSAGCAFYGNAVIADPTFGPSLFNATQIAPLSNACTVSSLSDEEMAMAAAFYQSAVGTVGGIMMQLAGRDYHGELPQTIVPMDVEDGRAVVMFLAACYAANKPGALIFNSNGTCIGNGTEQVTAMIDNVNYPSLNGTVPLGDAGGTYNAGLMIFYSPTGSLPSPVYTGTFNTTTGAVVADPNIGSPGNAIGGLYLTAHKFVSGGNMPSSLLKRLQVQNFASVPSQITLF